MYDWAHGPVALTIIVIVLLTCLIVNVILLYKNFVCLKTLSTYHNDIAAINLKLYDEVQKAIHGHEDINEEIKNIIRRQATLAGLLRTAIVEARGHDRRVARIMKKLGEDFDAENGDSKH